MVAIWRFFARQGETILDKKTIIVKIINKMFTQVFLPPAVNTVNHADGENSMEIIFHGRHDSCDAVESLQGIIRMLNERYHIEQFREMHLSVTLVDDRGQDVELIDGETDQAYRIFEVYRQGEDLPRASGRPPLKLVINNT
jgi:hypothetical protein